MSVRLLCRPPGTARGPPAGRCRRWKGAPSLQALPFLPQRAFTGRRIRYASRPCPKTNERKRFLNFLFELFVKFVLTGPRLCSPRAFPVWRDSRFKPFGLALRGKSAVFTLTLGRTALHIVSPFPFAVFFTTAVSTMWQMTTRRRRGRASAPYLLACW